MLGGLSLIVGMMVTATPQGGWFSDLRTLLAGAGDAGRSGYSHTGREVVLTDPWDVGESADRSRRPSCIALVDSSYIFFSMHMFIFESHSPPAFLQSASPVAGD